MLDRRLVEGVSEWKTYDFKATVSLQYLAVHCSSPFRLGLVVCSFLPRNANSPAPASLM